MAKKYDAHLTGVMAHGALSLSSGVPGWLTERMRQTFDEVTASRTQELMESFQSFCKGKIPEDNLHWIDVSAEPNKAVSFYSRYFDITVLGKYENLVAADERVLHPDQIAYDSGRPIIVTPKTFEAEQLTDTAVVAWDGKKNASRAFFDAMRLLETKEKVYFVSVGDPKTIPSSCEIDLVTVLKRHGIKAEHHFLPKSRSITQSILRFCEEKHASILVMGAYQHTKFSDDLFGGTTSTIIKEAQLPVLLSH